MQITILVLKFLSVAFGLSFCCCVVYRIWIRMGPLAVIAWLGIFLAFGLGLLLKIAVYPICLFRTKNTPLKGVF